MREIFMVCHRCNGKGRVWFLGNDGDVEREFCPICDGSGKIKIDEVEDELES